MPANLTRVGTYFTYAKCTLQSLKYYEHNERTNDLDLVVEEENRGHPSPPLRHSLETWTLKSPTLRGTGMKGNLHATVGGGFSQLLRF